MTLRRLSRGKAAVIGAVALIVAAFCGQLAAHDIPADTTVRMFIKPEGQTLRVLARVQMASINDIDWPTHKDGYLDLTKVDPFLSDASTMWISDYMDVFEGSRKLGKPTVASVRLVTDGDLSFEDTYETAVMHMTGAKIPDDTTLFPLQGFLDVMFEYPITSPESSFSLNPRFDRLGLRVTTDLVFVRANGATRSFEYIGLPGLVRLDPSSIEAAGRFVQMGFFQLLDNAEALLFLLCLVVAFRRRSGLVPVVATFAVAYTLTFIASAAYGMAPGALWFTPFISAMLAASVFYASIENILGERLGKRWVAALIFGLAYGFSFAIALGPVLQFAGAHPSASILAFSVGLDLGILAVLVLLVPAIELFFRFVASERIGGIVLSAIVAHTAWHWMTARVAEFWRYPLRLPPFDLMLLASVLRWAMAGVVLAGAMWALHAAGVFGRDERASSARPIADADDISKAKTA